MEKQKGAYREIMKATSLFGGVQFFNIVISIIKSKVIAVLLGPSGIGILGLLMSTISLVGGLTNFGLGKSAVRDISIAKETQNNLRISIVINVFKRLVWLTGALGLIITFILAPMLSEFTFGNNDYSTAFRWLSISLLISQLASGQMVLLHGMRMLKYLAKANMLGSLLGLLVSIPIYYYYEIKGIVPAILATQLLLLTVGWYFAKRIKIENVKVSFNETIFQGKDMLKMGFILSLSGLIMAVSTYLIQIFIGKVGNIEDVGLFNAGFAIIGTYVGLIFAAMTTDYYPKLSAVSHDNVKSSLLINQQAEIAILILAPILTIFFIFINWGIILLYSQKFTPVNVLIQWAALGMYFKAAAWAVAYILVAKGASKIFFWNELLMNSYMLIFNLLGYYFYGLDGLGVSFLVSYIIYFFQVFTLVKNKYEFAFGSEFYKIFFIQFSIGLICFIIAMFVKTPLSYILGLIFILISFYYSFIELDKRLGLKEILNKFNFFK